MKIANKYLQFVVAVLSALFLHVISANDVAATWYDSAWSKRIKITIDSDKVNGDLTNFPVYVDLSDLPDSFFDDVAANGADLRVTKSDGTTEVAREVVSLSSTDNTGELHFVANGTLSGTSNSDFYLYYGNGTASDYAEDATYGRENVWMNSYVGVWHMNEDPDGGANSILDSTSSDNDGSPQNMSSEDPISGKLGSALDFDGTEEYIQVADDDSLSFGNGTSDSEFTFSAWVNMDDASGFNILTKGDSFWGTMEYRFYTHTDDKLTILPIDDSNNKWIGRKRNTTFTTDENSWIYLVANYNASESSSGIDLYRNTSIVDDADVNAATYVAMENLSGSVQLGASVPSGRYADGTIDELRMASEARSAAWIDTEYNNQNSSSTFYSVGSAEDAPSVIDSWFDTGWQKRARLTIDSTHIHEDMTNYPVYVDLSIMPDAFFDNVMSAGEDIRVTTADGTTQVAAEVVSLSTTDNTGELHFLAPTVNANSNTEFFVYYNNGDAAAPAIDSTYGAENVWVDYIAVWHMAQDPTDGGSETLDSTSGDYDGDAQNMEAGDLTDCIVGQCLSFGGSNEYVDIGDQIDALDAVGDVTISAWMQRNSSGQTVNIGSASSTTNIAMYLNSTDYYSVHISGSTYYDASYGVGTNWTYLVTVFNGGNASADRIKPYRDGNYENLSNYGSPPTTTGTASTDYCIGRNNTTYSNGKIDELRLTTESRSENWIRSEYVNQNSPSTFFLTPTIEDKDSFSYKEFTPPDGGYLTSLTDNLVIKFERSVITGSGNITIKKASDDSVFETIDITGGKVSGSGTNTITINPANGFEARTDYYVEIDASAIDSNGGTSYAGFTDNGTWNFTSPYWFSGGWSGRVPITINKDQISSDLSNFPVYVDLDDMPDSFFDAVSSDGADIRVTKGDGITQVAREVVDINTTANDGEMYFVANGTLSSTNDTLFYIYYGNDNAAEPAFDASYGAENVWMNNYIGVWHFQQNPNGDAAGVMLDSSSNDHDGSPSGSMTSADFVDSYTGNGTDFDGSNDFLNVGDMSTDFEGESKVTISYHYQRSAANQEITMGVGTGASNFFSLYQSGGSDQNYFYPSDASNYAYFTDGDTDWNFTTWVFNGAESGTNSAALRVFKNASEVVPVYTGTIPGTIEAAAQGSFYIGKTAYNTKYTSGVYDEVRMSNVARSPAWIRAEYNNYNGSASFYTVGSAETADFGPSNFTPADDAERVAVDSNLVIDFNAAAFIQNGDITIKKMSDDSTIETIDVNSGLISGNGTTTITINPSNDLEYGTEYYINYEATTFSNSGAANYAAAITNNGDWNFTTLDDWYDSSWAKRVKLSVEPSMVAEDLTNFPVYVDLSILPDAFFDDVDANGADLRITTSDGYTEVAREVVSVSTTNNAGELHFLAPSLSSSINTDFYIYYDNSSATEPAITSAYGAENVWADYLAVWHMAQDPTDAGYETLDSSSNDYDANGQNMETGDLTTCVLGNCLSFGGSNEYLDTGSEIDALDGISAVTISAWMQRNSSGQTVNIGSTSSTTNIAMYLSSTDYYSVHISGSAYYDTAYGVGTNWAYLATVYNGGLASGERIKPYRDGNYENLSNYGSPPTTTGTATTNYVIGRNNTTYSNGKIDELRITTKTRSAAWIATEYANQNDNVNFFTSPSIENKNAAVLVDMVPPDNGYPLTLSSDISLVFDTAVTTGTGNITIKLASDDSTFEAIDVTSGQVTGQGTNTITINPSSSFADRTAYYVEVDATAIDTLNGTSYAGFTDNGTWSFTSPGWLGLGWSNRIPITINEDQISADLTNFPVYVDLSTMGDAFFDAVDANGADLRVTIGDGITEVAREVVAVSTTDNTGEMYFVANGTLSSSSDTQFYLYYGNTTATEPALDADYGAEKVWINNYVGVWHFQQDPNGDASGVVLDSTAADKDGTPSGSMTSADLVDTLTANGLDFDGSNDFINIGDVSTSFEGESHVTISSYYKRSSSNEEVTMGVGTDSNNFFSLTQTNDLNYFYPSDASNYAYFVGGDTDWNYTSWLFNGDESGTNNSALRVFNNANEKQLVYTGTIPGTIEASAAGSFYIGKTGYSAKYTAATYDEVRIANVARSPAWLRAEFNNINGASAFYTQGAAEGVAFGPSSYSPADDALRVAENSNLVLTFNDTAYIQNGNVTIKKVSDDSTVETIDINSGSVTGNGTTTITIDPSSDLDPGTDYYINYEATTFSNNGAAQYAAAVTNNGDWNFTTNDDWYDSSWDKRVKLSIDPALIGEDLTNFPVFVDLSILPDAFFDDVDANGADLRVTSSDGYTELAREVVELSTTSNTGEMHFLAPVVSASSANDFYIYYDNSSATAPGVSTTYGAENVWSDYLVVWHLAQTPTDAGYETLDSTSNNYHANGQNMESGDLVACQVGNCLSFGGSNEYLDTGSEIDALDGISALTISAWMQRNSSGQTVNIGSASSTTNIAMYLSSTDYYSVHISGSAYYDTAYGVGTNWAYLATVYNGGLASGERIKPYRDGNYENLSNYGSPPATTGTASSNYVIGRNNTTYSNGKIDELRITTKTRSAAWIAAEYANQKSPATFFYSPSIESKAAVSLLDLDPPDGSSPKTLNSNISITFDRGVTTGTGNITIKKANDDSIFETIDVTGAKVTGEGTATLTINPANGFEARTDYYVEIDSTAIDSLSGTSYAGFTDNATWNFTAPGWLGLGWSKRVPITIHEEQIAEDLTNFPIYIDLADLGDSFFDTVNGTGADIRVTKADGITEVAREIVDISTSDNTGEMYFVANGTLSSSSDTYFYLYYGNTSATEPALAADYGAEKVWINNYVGVWHFQQDPNGDSAGVILDSSAADQDGTPFGSMTSADLVDTLTGNGVDFDGSNDYVRVGDVSTSFEGESHVTISSYYKRNSSNEEVTMGVGTDSSQFFSITQTNDLNYFYPSDTSNYAYFIGGDTDWNYTSWIFNGDDTGTNTSALRVFNNASEKQLVYAGTIPGIIEGSAAGSLYIGKTGYDAKYTNAIYDEVRIANVARSPAWLRAEFNNINGKTSFYSNGSIETADFGPASFSPADDGSQVAVSSNLVITFNDTAYIQNGDITIKLLSNGSTVETIDVNSGLVSGNGSTTITINPASNLETGTEYYVNFDATTFANNGASQYAAAMTNNSDWNFTTINDWYDNDWLDRIELNVQSDKVAADLTNFPVYLDLSILPDSFFDDVDVNGADLRVTTSDGYTEIAREVVEISTTDNTGEMHFLAPSLSSSSNTKFFLYYNNSSATEPGAGTTYGSENVWSDYIAVWHMNENPTASGYETLDSSSNNNHANGQNMESGDLIACQVGNCLSFGGSNEYLDTGNEFDNLDAISAVTVSAWMQRNSGGQTVNIGSTSSTTNVAMYLNSTDYFSVHISGSTHYDAAAGVTTDWAHLMTVFNGGLASGERINAYINGTEDALSNYGSPGTTTGTATTNYVIGRNNTTYSNGKIDELRFTTKTRSEAWATTEYNNQSSCGTFFGTPSESDQTTLSVNTFSPADNGNAIGVDMNLSMVFDRAVTVQTGNITIKKSSDDSVFETIDVAGAKVTGDGTDTITINPANGLAASTDYYVEIDNGTFQSLGGVNYAGFTTNGNWNFSTPGWFDTTFYRRIALTIDSDKIDSDLTNFPVYVDLSDLHDDFFDDVQSTGADIRVTEGDGTTQVARELISINTTDNTGSMYFLANGTLSSSSDTTFFIYYSNGTATAPDEASTYGAQNVWNSDFEFIYHMNETDPTSGVSDSTSNQLDSTHSNMSSDDGVSGKINGALDFDGSNDKLIGDSTISLGADRAFSTWVYSESSTNDTILDLSDTRFMLTIKDSDEWRLYNSGNYCDVSVTSPTTTWHHMAVSHDGSSTASFYLDGELQTTCSVATSTESSRTLNVAGDYGSWWLDGMLDEYRLSDVARSAAWFKAEYNNMNSPSTFYTDSDPEEYPDTIDPLLLTLSPANGATAVGTTTDLVLTFNENVNVDTGNITIKKLSNGATVQAIDVTGSEVTGNGTTTITVDPNNLSPFTSYHVEVATTAIDDTSGNSYAGFTDNGTWTFTTGVTTCDGVMNYNGNVIDSNYDSYNIFPVDLDADGDMDIVAADDANRELTFFANDGNGNFTENQIDGSTYNIDVSVVDLDGDGDLDIVTAADANSYVYWYDNDGSENFTKKNVGSLSGPTAVDTADIDGDGDIDILVAQKSAGDISWYENNGSESFSNNSIETGLTTIDSIVLVDLDEDGDLDFLAADYNQDDVYWYENDGSESFAKTVIDGDLNGVKFVLNVDLDEDGDIDVLATSYLDDDVVWYENDGSESFTKNTIEPDIDGPEKAHYGDIDNDGDLDIVVAGGIQDQVMLYINDGSENFTEQYLSLTFDGPVDIYIVDFDGDGVKDTAVSSNGHDDLYWFKSQNCYDTTAPTISAVTPVHNSTGAFRNTDLVINFDEPVYEGTGDIVIKETSNGGTVETISVTSSKVVGAGTADITIMPSTYFSANTGYYIEIAATAYDDVASNSFAGVTGSATWNFTTLSVGACDGDLSFNGTAIDTNLDSPNAIPVDLDEDGDIDIVAVDDANRELNWYSNDGNGNFTEYALDGSTYTYAIDVVDFDADGDLDIVTAADANSYVYWYDNDGSESFTKKDIASQSGPTEVYARDMDGDGDVDLVVASKSAGDIYWHDNLNGSLFTSNTIETSLTTVDSIKLVDLDHDDDIDIIAADYNADDIYWYENNGSVGFTKNTIELNLNGVKWIYPFDMENDGDIDILATSYLDDDVVWYENDGSENFTKHTITYDLDGAERAFPQDIDGDGDLDIVATGALANKIMLYYNNGSQAFIETDTVELTINNPIDIDMADFDGDGVLDILVTSMTQDDLYWYRTEGCIDTTAPTLSATIPVDNTSYYSRLGDLVLEFSERVYEANGDVIIKKSSDDSTVETIDINSAQVWGNGSTTITVQPSTALDSNTEFYVQVNGSALVDVASNAYAGISDTTTWSFTSAPACTETITRTKYIIDSNFDNYNLYPVDLDDDGDIDLVAADDANRELSWFRNDGSESFTEVSIDGSTYSYDVTVVDFDDDGDLDILVAADANSYAYWYENDGSESFTKNNIASQSGPTQIEAADMDGDGDIDVVVAGKSAGDIYWYDNLNGSLFTANAIETSLTTVDDFEIIDLDQDDDLDIIAVDYNADDIYWYVNNGSQGFTKTSIDLNFNAGSDIQVVDLDNDGDMDFVATSYLDDDVVWYENNGSEGFTKNTIDSDLDGARRVSVADMDGDGDYDIVATGEVAGDVILYTNNGAESFIESTVESNLAGVYDIYFFDMDSNGVMDIVAGSATDDDIVWYDSDNCGDFEAPTVSSFSPADGATNAAIDTNLVITFNELVHTMTGNIVIQLLSNGSTVESFAVGDAAVTGNGTTTITINPTSDLEYETDYNVTIASTAFDDNGGNSYAGFSDNGTWNFTTASATQPGWLASAWGSRLQLTINGSQVNGDLTNFPVYVDLSDLSSKNFFNNVRSDGGEIRVTQGDGLSLVPIDLVSIDTTDNQGELWFKAPFLSGSSDTNFYIYYDNANGRALNADHAMGRHNVWTNGYVAVYHMDQDPNGDKTRIITNSVANKNHGTPNGTMTSADKVSGQVGNGTDFDGSDDYIDYGNPLDLQITTALTLEAWIKTSLADYEFVLAKDDSTNKSYNLVKWNDQTIKFQIYKSDTQYTVTSAETNLNNGSWRHVVGVNDGTDLKIYVDANSTTNASAGGTMDNDSVDFRIGYKSNSTYPFDGVIDEVRVSNKARSADWVVTEYNNQNSPSTFYSVAASVEGVNDDSTPKISSSYPRNGQTRFPLRANLTLNFNETVQAGSGNITIYESNGSSFEAIAIGSATISGSSVTINPSSNLAAGTSYYVLIDNTAIEDGSSNAFSGLSDSSGWHFTTEGGATTTASPNNLFQFGF